LKRGRFSHSDLGNIEQLFTFLEIAKEAGLPAGKLYDSLIVVLATTIAHKCKVAMQRGPDRVYSRFVRALIESTRREGKFEDRHFPEEHFDLYTDRLISLNYDVLLDHALTSNSCFPHYALATWPGDESFFEFKMTHPFELLKPHGSLNWVACADHNDSDWAWAVPLSDEAIVNQLSHPRWEREGLLWRSTELRSTLACTECGSSSSLRPILVAPGYGKKAAASPMQMVWNSIVHAIFRAEKIVILGYSLPETDFDFVNLLRAGTSKGGKLKIARL
jgi:hypothetical protein